MVGLLNEFFEHEFGDDENGGENGEKPSPNAVADDMCEDASYSGRVYHFMLVCNPQDISQKAKEVGMRNLVDNTYNNTMMSELYAPVLFVYKGRQFLCAGSKKAGGFFNDNDDKMQRPSESFRSDLQGFESNTGNTGWLQMVG